jgi:DNA-binding GntR family transcriptional regulator
LAPGERLREVDLADRFRVSRPVIREALHLLRNFGLVDEQAFRGYRVVFYSKSELADLYAFRGLIFSFIAKLACERASNEQIEDFAAAVDRLVKAAGRSGNGEAYELMRNATHDALSRATGSAHDVNRRRYIATRTSHQYSVDAVRTIEQRRQSAARWIELLGLVRARDSAGAERQALAMNDVMKEAALEAYSQVHGSLPVGLST